MSCGSNTTPGSKIWRTRQKLSPPVMTIRGREGGREGGWDNKTGNRRGPDWAEVPHRSRDST